MKIFTSLFLVVGLAGSAWAGSVTPSAPGPEMTTGLIGMTLAAGAIYLIKRRKRS